MKDHIQNLIAKIQEKKKTAADKVYSAEGLLKLQEVAKTYSGDDALIWSSEILTEIQTTERPPVLKTNVPMLDDMIVGFRPQQLVTLSAHSKHGKTAFALFLIEQLENANPLLIPLEQSNYELVEQRLENNYSIPKFLSPKNLAARVTVEWIEERIIEGIAKHNSKVVVIDHLGYIYDFGSNNRYARENHAFRIQIIMQSLKSIAKRWNITIVLLVHISQTDEGKPPSLQDLKGSSSILQESDLVLMLWRKNELKNKIRIYEDKTMVSVLANRKNGKNGSIGMTFDRSTGRYVQNNEWVKDMVDIALSSQNKEEFDSW